MLMSFLCRGTLIGFLIAMPIGAIDMICIRKTLIAGMRAGFITGLGAAIADTLAGAFAIFGISALTMFLSEYKFPLHIFGGLMLCILGAKSLLKKISSEPQTLSTKSLAYAFMTTFFLAISSPVTILSFLGAYAAVGVGFEETSFIHGLALALGVFLGSTLWWFLLSGCISLFRDRMAIEHLHWVNVVTGIILMGCGAAVIAAAFIPL